MKAAESLPEFIEERLETLIGMQTTVQNRYEPVVPFKLFDTNLEGIVYRLYHNGYFPFWLTAQTSSGRH
ncbi:hypothetical protein [Marinobacter daepoensis]|uniref:hypothetical protein n=1 Tax=Marinobacter daepoensis TaxID=262077 RepID=UPI0003F8C130|nr:hypothetical protein [Marinobacter daepoensis]